jgi:hypothetical protein
MNFKKIYLPLFLLFAISLTAFSQTDTIGLRTIITKSVKVANEHPFEKVYLHFDKPYYAIGDTIWFKAYLTIDMHQPSQLSKIIYVDVISSKDSIVQSLKLQVTGSSALGNIMLFPSLYRQGNYHIRAYTNWMRNEDPAYFFNKTVALGSINNQILTNISLSGLTKNSSSKVTAKIQYKDPAGKAYANRKVNWKILNDDETLSKGKGVTNANGILDVTVTTNKTAVLTSCALVTVIDVTDNKSLTNSFTLTHALDQPDVQFFPEGGDLIAGIRSRVAFKAIKPNGLGLDIKGTVVDNNGTVVAEFASNYLGMGQFAMIPEGDKTYKANLTFPDGSQTTVNLPKAKSESIGIAVYNTNPDTVVVKVSANQAYFQKNKNRKFYLIGQNGQTICYAAQAPLQNNVYSASVAKTKFPSGVIKFTLFNDHGEPLAERIIFNQRNDLLNIIMKTPQATYSPRQNVKVSVLAQSQGLPSQANLSVAIIDESKVPFDNNSEMTILTNLLLTSDLKGYVEKPNYYFTNPDDKTKANLDILMLTQGYSRFSYKDIIADKIQAAKFLPEQGINITGTIRNSTGLPINRGNLTLVATDRNITKNTVANTVGEFKFANLVLPDSTKISINAKNNVNAGNLIILLDNIIYQPPTPNIDAPAAVTNIDSTLNSYLQNSKQQLANSHILKEVIIKSSAPEKKPSHQDFPELLGLSPIADHVISGAQLSGCTFLAQCLMGGTLGTTYSENNLYIMRTFNAGDKRPMQIYYNGLQIDFDYLNSIAAIDVESIEVFNDDGLSGINRLNNTNGVLVINGKKVVKKTMSRDEINKVLYALQTSAVSTLFRGYTQAKVFYSPRYYVAKTATSFGGDLRTIILWNPKVITDKTGAASFDFFSSDGKGSYRAIIEGIDSNGNIGRYVYHFKVQ